MAREAAPSRATLTTASRGVPAPRVGYDVAMTDSEPETSRPADRDTGSDDDQLVSDEQLPEDLQPAKNPMAREPGEDDERGGLSAPGSDAPAPATPDAGQPG